MSQEFTLLNKEYSFGDESQLIEDIDWMFTEVPENKEGTYKVLITFEIEESS